MPQESLLATLNEILQERSEQQQQRQNDIKKSSVDVDGKRDALRKAEAQKEQAVFEDEDMQTRITELHTHYNGLIEKPQVLLNKIQQLTVEQGKSYQRREEATVIVEQSKDELRKAEVRLKFAQQKHAEASQEWREINEQIMRVHAGS
jgi:chromosome segregation ATPase